MVFFAIIESMKSVYHYVETNKMKTWFLMFIFMGVIIGVGWYLSYYYHSPTILYYSLFFSLISNVWAYWFSDKMVLKMANARELSFQENPELHRIVENLAITAGIPKPNIFLVEDPTPNAFATGRNTKHAVVAVTTGLLHTLNRSELEGVIAHELSHIRHYDILISTIAVVFVGALSMIARMMFYRRGDSREEGGVFHIILAIVVVVLLPLVGTLLRLALSRKREYYADLGGVLLTRYPEGLASALEKIASYEVHTKQLSPLEQKQSIAHLFISNPLSSRKINFFRSIFSTHPPIKERINRLRSMGESDLTEM